MLITILLTVTLLAFEINGYTQRAPSIGHICQDGCHVCIMNEYHEQIKFSLRKQGVCDSSGHKFSNGDVMCIYGYPGNVTTYGVDEKIATVDGCNTCRCTQHGAFCTKSACANTGFAKPSTEPLYGNCNDNGNWYNLGALWEARDGCNTCTCVGIGNYQGPFICTQGICNTKGSAVVG